jgi:hypothetical protein
MSCGAYETIKGKGKVIPKVNKAPRHEDVSLASLSTTP